MDRKREAGFSMIECLVAVALLSVTAMAVTHSTVQSMVITKRNIRNSIANQLALSKIEEYASIDPENYDATDSATETALAFDDVSFRRTTNIVVNADLSRTVTVTVNALDATLAGTVAYTNTFALWGNQ